MSRQERLLRAFEISPPKPDTSQLGQRPPELATQVRPQFVAGEERLRLGLAVRTAQAKDLGAMHAAASVDAADASPKPPTLHRLRPLLREVVLRDGLKRADQLAIDETRHEWVELTGHRGDGGLIEQPEALRDVASEDQAARLRDPADGGCRRIVPHPDVDRTPSPLPSFLKIARQQSLVVVHDGEPRVDGCLFVLLEEALRAFDPTPHGCQQRRVDEQVHGDPDVPAAKRLLERAGPAFAAYGRGDHEEAVAGFLSLVSGLDWDACRAVIDEHVPDGVAQAIVDADTFFGIELPALTEWAFGPDQAATLTQPILSVLGSDTELVWVEVAELLRSWFPEVEELTVEGAGHLLQMQHPEPVVRGVAEFLGRHAMLDAEVAGSRAHR